MANRSGRPTGHPNCRLTVEQRFEMKVDRSGECHRWTGAHNSDGYGSFWLDGRTKRAHTVALKLAGIDVPEGMTVDHVWARGCRHRDCVRIDHLEVVTYRENTLRGNCASAINARKKVCYRGHDALIFRRTAKGRLFRICRQCEIERGQRRRGAA